MVFGGSAVSPVVPARISCLLSWWLASAASRCASGLVHSVYSSARVRRCAGSRPILPRVPAVPRLGGDHGVREGALALDSMTSKAAVTRQPGV